MRLDRPCGSEGWATRHYSGEPPERCSRCGDNGTGARFRWLHIGSGAVVCGPCRLPTHQAAQSRRAGLW